MQRRRPDPAFGILEGLDNILTLGKKKRKTPLPENDSADPETIVTILKKKIPYTY